MSDTNPNVSPATGLVPPPVPVNHPARSRRLAALDEYALHCFLQARERVGEVIAAVLGDGPGPGRWDVCCGILVDLRRRFPGDRAWAALYPDDVAELDELAADLEGTERPAEGLRATIAAIAAEVVGPVMGGRWWPSGARG